jgi:DNA-binding response OmpR family regulator
MDMKPSQKKSALLVEGDGGEMRLLRECFEGLGFELWEATSLRQAITIANERSPSLVMSEIVLPDGSGFSLCQSLRESPASSAVPIVLLSRWSTEADRNLAFQCGADDFVAKPFYARELTSRIRAVLRRSRKPEQRTRTEPGTLGESPEFRIEEHGVRVAGRFIGLTPREHALLVALVKRQGRVMSRRELIEEAWQGEVPLNARNVDAHVKSLRRKIGLSPGPIETVRGIGYRLAHNPGLERTLPSVVKTSATG